MVFMDVKKLLFVQTAIGFGGVYCLYKISKNNEKNKQSLQFFYEDLTERKPHLFLKVPNEYLTKKICENSKPYYLNNFRKLSENITDCCDNADDVDMYDVWERDTYEFALNKINNFLEKNN